MKIFQKHCDKIVTSTECNSYTSSKNIAKIMEVVGYNIFVTSIERNL